jgi:hypothetical protein
VCWVGHRGCNALELKYGRLMMGVHFLHSEKKYWLHVLLINMLTIAEICDRRVSFLARVYVRWAMVMVSTDKYNKRQESTNI